MRSEIVGGVARKALSAWLALGLAGSAFAFGGRPVDAATGPDGAPLPLVWFDAWGVCPLASIGAAAETKRLLAELGVRAEWMSSETALEISGPWLKVLLYDVEPSRWGLGEHTLGAVKGEGGGSRDAVFVFTPNVIRAAGHLPERGSCEVVRMQARIGRALARVIVHEIVHAVAPDHAHAERGIMNASLSMAALLGPSAVVDPECAAAFLSALRRGLDDAEPGSRSIRSDPSGG